MSTPPLAAVLAYHEVTKHRLPNRYANSRGFLDWDTQPNPFRRYEGCPLDRLTRVDDAPSGPTLDAVYDPSRVPAESVNASSVARLLFDSMALSAWKQLGDKRWSLRCNPSSGNLHPTEAYVIGTIPGLSDAPALWHYAPLLHALERRAALEPELWDTLRGDADGVMIGLSSIPWRESWKYGERAFRYCQHDVGHAIAALALSAGALGWHLRAVPSIDDDGIARLLGLPPPSGPEPEHPDLMLFVGPRPPSHAPVVPESLALELVGTPNRLSESHHPWPIIETVAHACARRDGVAINEPQPPVSPEPSPSGASAHHVFRTRRSAVDMDGVTGLSRAAWLRMLARTLPRPGHAPFASLLGRPRVHLLLFVHRVEGVEPGLYLLLRDPSVRATVAATMHDDFEWAPIDTGPLALPLWRLELADTRPVAALVSCRQAIAADGAFAVAMLAELGPALADHGAWMYRHLHWEAGAIGQVLYLEAEAAGRRATGIGCFFDDGVHELIGAKDHSLHTIYHFTVGGGVEDTRIAIVDAYHHLAP
ncbi:SagB/ThcOx family dehydrogenase [Enhygromyxa salina]|uniref:Nitroreductase family protein n=1 Tax=Enhygromyxa salina TaxID=215803 RepID=A0A2S9YFN3_9BACT|nr:SagB/ThcOx family dehydrogenase [Enhygromyxa salina]PRQ03909.1 Nitroreductase family protein [Enhygromyxa salina]